VCVSVGCRMNARVCCLVIVGGRWSFVVGVLFCCDWWMDARAAVGRCGSGNGVGLYCWISCMNDVANDGFEWKIEVKSAVGSIESYSVVSGAVVFVSWGGCVSVGAVMCVCWVVWCVLVSRLWVGVNVDGVVVVASGRVWPVGWAWGVTMLFSGGDFR
jgi:hypothetical protein